MIRLLVGFIGVLTALVPDRVLGVFERLALKNPDESIIKPWVGPAMRAEGVGIVVASLAGGKAYAWTMNLTGIFGGIVLAFPDLYPRLAATFLYEQPEQVEWHDRFTTDIRLIGAFYVFIAARAFNRRRRSA
ncbi:hypothetical protein [Natronomonas amylolytica]|uniref:hypothetical protein n=1 Tax=Natronomonas amylolytica TaxID=3108498 RepID=UPI003009F797